MKTPTSSSRKIEYVAECAALLTAALALSFLETLIPISALIPIPGFRLGFANLAIIVAFFRLSPLSAIVIAILKSVITGLLFSGVTSIAFSICGSLLSILLLFLTSYILKKRIGFIGTSVLMALAHNVGQLAAACFLMHSTAVVYYFPALAAASLVCGTVTGIILMFLPDFIYTRKVLV